jgi:predicted metal-dependent phosphoesterase TrpH
MFAHTDALGVPAGVEIVEIYNGGSRDQEDQIAIEHASQLGYRGIGGSDSHIVSHVGRCATRFDAEIKSIDDLVLALKTGQFEAVNLKTGD